MYSYFVYMHRTPSNKVYIGITRQSRPEIRWGSQGQGYIGNNHFCNAIRKYGWDNIDHIILYSGLSQGEAFSREVELIALYNATDPNYGYNHTFGGDSNPMDLECNRKKVSLALQSIRGQDEWRQYMSNKLMGHPVSDETRRKISIANTGRKISDEVIQRRVKSYLASFTEERRRKISEASKRQVFDAERRRKMSEARKGIPMTEAAKRKLSEVKRQKVADGFQLIWVHNDICEHAIQLIDLEKYKLNGYETGRLMNKHIFMNNGEIEVMASDDEVASYESKGYVRGTLESRRLAIKKGRQTHIYTYKGVDFNTAQDLTNYLNLNGYPDIVSSTVTEMCRKGKSIKYPDILSNLSRRKVR